MRSIDLLARDYPNKTGRELLELQEKDKIEDQLKFEKHHEEIIKFINSLNSESKYMKGEFGLDQKYLHRIDDAYVHGDGSYSIETTMILIFIGTERGVLKEGHASIEIKNKMHIGSGDKIYSTGLTDLTIISEAEWNEAIAYVMGIQKFFEKN